MVDVKTPKDQAELEQMLQDDKVLAQFKSPADLGEWVSDFVKDQMNQSGDEWDAKIKASAQAALGEMLRNNEASVANLRGNAPQFGARSDAPGSTKNMKGAAYNSLAIGAVLDNEFESIPDFFHHARPSNKWSSEIRAKWEQIKNDYSTVTPDAGGFLVPEVLRAQLLSNSLEAAIARPRANVVVMDAPNVPFPTVDETTHSGSVYGGITGTWIAEGEELPESQARFGRVVLRVNKLVSYCEVPAELPMDAPVAFGNFIDNNMPAAITFFEDSAFLTGNGAGKPLGALHANNTGLVTVAKETNQGADTVVWENLVKMYSRMLPSSIPNAVWVLAIDTFPQIATMALAVGTGGSAVWLNNGVDGPPATILGRPAIFTEKVPKLGDASDVSFIDFGQYLLGDMQQMRVQSSEHFKFNRDVISYRVIERADGQPWMKSPLTPANGSTNTLSPYVTLAERA